jgi:hypothetical protein
MIDADWTALTTFQNRKFRMEKRKLVGVVGDTNTY